MDATREIITRAKDLLAREQAAAAYDLLAPALHQAPGNIELLLVLADTLNDLDRPADATAAYRDILALAPRHTFALKEVRAAADAVATMLRLADTAERMRAYGEARENFEAALHLDPRSHVALTRLLIICGFEGRLADAERYHGRLIEALAAADLAQVQRNDLVTMIYQAVMRPLPRALYDRLRDAFDAQNTALAAQIPPPPRPSHPKTAGRLRIGYLSSGLRDHPIGHVTAGLFAAHDRSKVEVHVFYWPLGEATPYTERIRNDADFFRTTNDAGEMIEAIVVADLDVLIYLDGYMLPDLLPVIARRPAPRQVYWLGHAGACDITGIDAFIADDIVVPPEDENLYRAEVIRLPAPYHPASPHTIGPDMSRAEAGLPETGFVFCAFNNPEKIDIATFESWMRILARVDESLLWLSRTRSAAIAENLRAAAQERGIDGARLIFADRLPDKALHLARHRHAGLFLDTFGLNASTTALDALWAGLPLVTVTGDRFASRIATTFLRAVGLGDLACQTPAAFEDRAVELATHPQNLAEVRARLAANLTTEPLFQTDAFCRKLEAALAAYVATHPDRSFREPDAASGPRA